mmetsp:Transcript_30656/g.117270  ORF Transcript_30656/g.117270 Transcript_30656/m.117270 type:complete len:81 (+) Transcript_30656:631-873(+)
MAATKGLRLPEQSMTSPTMKQFKLVSTALLVAASERHNKSGNSPEFSTGSSTFLQGNRFLLESSLYSAVQSSFRESSDLQ